MPDGHSEVQSLRAGALRIGMEVLVGDSPVWKNLKDVKIIGSDVWIYWGASHSRKLDKNTEIQTRYTYRRPAVDTGPGLTVKDFKDASPRSRRT